MMSLFMNNKKSMYRIGTVGPFHRRHRRFSVLIGMALHGEASQ